MLSAMTIDLSFLDDAPEPPFDRREAVMLMDEVDKLVEQLGVDGRHPDIVAAAELAVEANRLRDMARLRAACSLANATARRLALEKRDGRPKDASRVPDARCTYRSTPI